MTSKTGTREEWLAARNELLAKEKKLTRISDERSPGSARSFPGCQSSRSTRSRPPTGPKTLAELFDGRSQLAVYHFMFGPGYEAGCPTCYSIADSFNGVLPHLQARDVTMICVSSAPLEKLLAYRDRMGWSFTWASAHESDFNADLGISASEEQTRKWAAPMLGQLPPIAARNAREIGTDLVNYLTETQGFSTFVLDDRAVYHTYSTGARGVEFLMVFYGILDRLPKGRDEGDAFQVWIRRHDEYDSQ